MQRHSTREVDVDTEAGSFRIGLWGDNWVLAWRRTGNDETAEEVFDVLAREAEDLVPPLAGLGLTEQAARGLADQLIAERAEMDKEEKQG
jgi:hypothetical protein